MEKVVSPVVCGENKPSLGTGCVPTIVYDVRDYIPYDDIYVGELVV